MIILKIAFFKAKNNQFEGINKQKQLIPLGGGVFTVW